MEDEAGVDQEVSKPTEAKGREDREWGAKEFAAAVEKRMVFGKLPYGTSIGGNELVIAGLPGSFADHGPDKILRNTPVQTKAFEMLERLYNFQSPQREFGKWANTHTVTITPAEGEEGKAYSIVSIWFSQDFRAPDSRGGWTLACVHTLMPKEISDRFVKAITERPDLLEGFYQATFPGLDSQPDEVTGMRRVSADGFYLLTSQELDRIPGRAGYDARMNAITDLLESSTKYSYSKSYGVGRPYKRY